jgi:hypothetical protein
MIPMLVILSTAGSMFLVWWWNYQRQTEKLLEQHQKEWNEIKRILKDNNATEIEIDEAYIRYIEHLMNTRDSTYGACIPLE